MYLKIRCDKESEKFYKISWELNKAQCRLGLRLLLLLAYHVDLDPLLGLV